METETLAIAQEIRWKAIKRLVHLQERGRYGSDWSWDVYEAKRMLASLLWKLLTKGAAGNRRLDDDQHAFFAAEK